MMHSEKRTKKMTVPVRTERPIRDESLVENTGAFNFVEGFAVQIVAVWLAPLECSNEELRMKN